MRTTCTSLALRTTRSSRRYPHPPWASGSMFPEPSLGNVEGCSYPADRVSLCCPSWSAVGQSQLTATFAYQVQVILLLQPSQ
ncbi:hypothetical protein AAY473_004752 [Plecturocebus cupreus]